MSDLPTSLWKAVPPGKLPAVEAWWAGLSDDARARLAELSDEHFEAYFFTPQADEAGVVDRWEQVPPVTGGRFVPTDDTWGLKEWGPGYFEHLLQHPELSPDPTELAATT